MARILVREVAPEETTQWHNGEEQHCGESDEKLNDSQNLTNLSLTALDSEDVNARSDIDGENDHEEEETSHEMLSASPPTWYIGPFGQSRGDHEQTGDSATEGHCRPPRGSSGLVVKLLLVVLGVEGWRIVSGVEPEHAKMHDPDTVEVDQHVEPRSCFLVGFEKDLLPCYIFEFVVSLSGRHINHSSFVLEDEAFDTFGIPEQLIHIIVSDHGAVVFFTPYIFALEDFETLVSEVLVQGSDDLVQVCELLHRFHPILAFGRIQVVQGALVDEAETFGHETDLIRLTPAEQVESNLSGPIMLRHPIHTRLPAILGSFQAVVTFQALQGLSLILRVLISLLLGCSTGFSSSSVGFSELHVGETDSIVKIEVGCKIPASVIGIIASDVIGV